MATKQALPSTIYAFTIDGKRLWLPEPMIISDSIKYHKQPPPSIEGVRDIFVMVQQEQISVGKAMQYFEAWLDGKLMESFEQDGRA